MSVQTNTCVGTVLSIVTSLKYVTVVRVPFSTNCSLRQISCLNSRLTSSFSCQLIAVIITTLIIHHSFASGSKPTFSANPSHLYFFYTQLHTNMVLGNYIHVKHNYLLQSRISCLNVTSIYQLIWPFWIFPRPLILYHTDACCGN